MRFGQEMKFVGLRKASVLPCWYPSAKVVVLGTLDQAIFQHTHRANLAWAQALACMAAMGHPERKLHIQAALLQQDANPSRDDAFLFAGVGLCGIAVIFLRAQPTFQFNGRA